MFRTCAGFCILNYLDEFAGGDTSEKAHEAYETLGGVLQCCGLEKSVENSVFPTTVMT